jgi:class 3 adenylate cyclase
MGKDQLSRKLAVILHADVVGSTSLVQKDETLAHKRIQLAFKNLSKSIHSYGGITREIRGDALVAEFERASDAVSATLAFQSENKASNEKYTDEIRPEVRVGIALGEVIIADNTITGAGVILAQRLEQLSEQGGLCISSAIREALPDRLPFQYGPLGEQKVKGFDEPVRVFFVALNNEGSIPAPDLNESARSVQYPPGGFARRHTPVLLILGFVVLAGSGYFTGFISLGITPENPFDGRWKVNVDLLTGCLNNEPKSYAITVEGGSINEPNLRFPKTGLVSGKGEFRIESHDSAGELMNTQMGNIVGHVGKGYFQGRKSSCNGNVTMMRLE